MVFEEVTTVVVGMTGGVVGVGKSINDRLQGGVSSVSLSDVVQQGRWCNGDGGGEALCVNRGWCGDSVGAVSVRRVGDGWTAETVGDLVTLAPDEGDLEVVPRQSVQPRSNGVGDMFLGGEVAKRVVVTVNLNSELGECKWRSE